MNANGLIRGSYPDSVIVFGLMVRDGRVMDAPPAWCAPDAKYCETAREQWEEEHPDPA